MVTRQVTVALLPQWKKGRKTLFSDACMYKSDCTYEKQKKTTFVRNLALRNSIQQISYYNEREEHNERTRRPNIMKIILFPLVAAIVDIQVIKAVQTSSDLDYDVMLSVRASCKGQRRESRMRPRTVHKHPVINQGFSSVGKRAGLVIARSLVRAPAWARCFHPQAR